MSEHTAEPWRVVAGVGEYAAFVLGPNEDEGIADFLHDADARRAVAAVNACKGIPIEALEKITGLKLTVLASSVRALTTDRTPEEEAAIDRAVQAAIDEELQREADQVEALRLLRQIVDARQQTGYGSNDENAAAFLARHEAQP